MEKDVFTVAGKNYVIKPLVLGQIKQISNLVKGLELPTEIDVASIMDILGNKLPEFVAIVLVEEGKKPSDKNLEELTREIEDNFSLDEALGVVEHFFDITPISSPAEKIKNIVEKIMKNQTG
ncbi:MAG TPA: hypothetical protein PLU14_00320 [Caldisericia bacterium]|nr:hypothetical protein [Caldisericia bacterium]